MQSIRLGKLVTVNNLSIKRVFKEAETYTAVWVKDNSGTSECILLTDAELERAKFRAKRNPEDLTKRSWLSKLID